MPVVDGLEATRQITKTLPQSRVVILTVSEEDKDVFEAIKCGAYGYLSRRSSRKNYANYYWASRAAKQPLLGSTATKILQEFAAEQSKTCEAADLRALTEREQEVLKLLATGLTNKEIGARLSLCRKRRQEPS